ncbi:polysaccharide deacetylase family protein [Paenibacillus oryzisoli]|uniref:polysaccharide deacetylase n=1 Tax=Paenibacillus oryzisoli TaxID=1850517 RepID=UPI003D27A8DB
MRHHVQAAKNRLYLVSLSLALLIVVSLLLGSVPAYAAGDDEAALAEQSKEAFLQLQTGKRMAGEERSYETPEQPTVYLTFDDGPSKLTDQVLDILDEKGVKATFFALGVQAKEYPKQLKRIVDSGHALGNHTYNHVYNELYSDFQTFWDQVQKTENIFDELVGVRPQLVRAPGGTATNFDGYYYYLMDQAGYTMEDWNVDSGDSKRAGVPVSEIWQTVKVSPLSHEINILFHDGTGHDNTVKVLPQVIDYYQNLGYSFATLTTKVKPKQFGLSKIKWNRGMSLTHFTKLYGETKAYAAEHSQSGPVEETPAPPKEEPIKVIAMQPEEESTVPLDIQLPGQEGFAIDPSLYRMHANRIELPLRALVEKIGGQVAWQSDTKTATAHYGIYDITYHLQTRSMELFKLGQPVGTYAMADMDMRNNQIIVPLRKTIDSLGGRVMSARIESDKREVALSLRPYYFYNEPADSILQNSLFALAI